MFDHNLKQYFVDKDIKPTVLEVQSRSSKKKVMMAYFPHPISGAEYQALSRLTRNLFSSCALDLKHILLIPSSDLGKNINLMDAIDTASHHVEGKTPRRVSFIEEYDLSSLEKTVEEKKAPEKKPRAGAAKRTVKAKSEAKKKTLKTEKPAAPAKKKVVAKRAPARKAPASKAPAKKSPVKRVVAKKAPAKKSPSSK